MKLTSLRAAGFTLVEIMIVVAIIGLLAAIAIPNFVKARTTAQRNACINNLRQIDGAIQQWALETKQGPSANAETAKSAIQQYLGRSSEGEWPDCPAGGSYLMTTVSEKPTCTYSGAPYNHKLGN